MIRSLLREGNSLNHNRLCDRGSRDRLLARAARPVLQALESRRMLSASVVDGALVIEGTRRGDAINVFAADSGTTVRVHVNGEQHTFVRSSFDRIRVKAGRGDDSVVIGISGSFAVKAPSVIDAGDGDDVVQGG